MARNNLIMWEKDNCMKSTLVARRLEISPSYWSNIKSGRANPTYKVMRKFEEEFHPDNIIMLFSED